jgi:uncharacterized protein YfaS (alpha-2-macroglobulin family)
MAIITAVSLTAVLIIAAGVWAYRSFRGELDTTTTTTTTTTTQTGNETGSTAVSSAKTGSAGPAKLTISLEAGQAQEETAAANPVVTGEPLTDAETAQILDRLPDLTGEAGDVQEYKLPDAPLPPPRTGETISEPFPPPPAQYTPPPVPDGPLEVLRYSPEGDIGLAPFVNVTFNQPMVPLTDLESLGAADVPVTLTPDLPGVWQWVSPQTLRFEYQSDEIDRLPMATEFTAEIPAGTQSAAGNALAETVRWTFNTPPVQMVYGYPNYDPQPVEPTLFILFDQMIEPTAVLQTIRVEANGSPQSMRLATPEEIEADATVKRLAADGREGYWLALRPQQPFPVDVGVIVTIGPGTPSAEGPLTTTEAQTFSFSTYAPLRITNSYCGCDECRPLTPFSIEFNNPLDLNSFSDDLITVEPELAGMVIRPSYNMLTIQGLTEGRTTYNVTIDGRIQDAFGQTLGENETLTFKVGSAQPYISGPSDVLVTLDPSASEPALSLYTMNEDKLAVQAYAVTPADWPAYLEYRRQYDNAPDNPPTPPGELVYDETIQTHGEKDVLTETAVSLQEALGGNTGHLILIIKPPRRFSDLWEERSQTVQTWVQATQIGVDAIADPTQLLVWTTALQDGSPLNGVTVTPVSATSATGSAAQTDGQGVAAIPLTDDGTLYLVAQQGEDSAILPANSWYWDEYGWQRSPLQDELRWHILDDRAIYRPGEEVHVKGWLRQISGGSGVIRLPGDEATSVSYQVYGPQGNELSSGTAEVTGLGGFDFAFTVPENSNLGYAAINLQANGGGQVVYGRDSYHQFQIQEFRRPEFEVAARQESVGPYVVDESATVAVSASYYAGGPLPNADTSWTVTSTPASYSPPGWSEFVFGEWTPWWFAFGYGGDYYEEPYFAIYPGDPGNNERLVQMFTGKTDANGEHFLQINFEALEGARPFTVNAEAVVMDVNRQAWASSTSLLVHPAELYVGLRSERTFVEQGEPLEIEAIVTDIDGAAVSGVPVQVTAVRLEWNLRDGQWVEEEVDGQECSVTSAAEPLLCTFDTAKGGEMKVTAVVADAAGRQNQSSFTRWVSGGEQPVQRNVEMESLTLIPDKESYQPGDVAEILVQSPFAQGEGLLTLNHGGIASTERFALENGGATLRIPITEAYLPLLSVQVDAAGSAPRTDDNGDALPGVPPRPAYASGSLDLSIPPYSRELSVQIAPQAEKLEPGEETAVSVTVLNAQGGPQGDAEVALFVVDEAILALTNYQLANPLDTFYTPPGVWLDSRYGRDSIILANPETLAEAVGGELAQRAAGGALGGVAVEEELMMDAAPAMEAAPPMATAAAGLGAAPANEAAAPPIDVRTDFNPLAVFAPAVRTDGQGEAEISFTLPDNLTRYRIMAVAVAGDNLFGIGEKNLTARLPLMVRPSAPRFLNFGDTFELPVVVQNQTDEPLTVDVAIETSNLLLTGDAGRRVVVPANDRVEVRFPAAADSAGTARFQVAAVAADAAGGEYADAAAGELPVYTPATTEAFATYGVVDTGAVAQPFLLPDGVIPGFGGLEINTSSTALQALTDAVLYLTSHRYDSSEELASRILAVAALREVLDAFAADGLPTPEEMETAVLRDIAALEGMQNSDGGFPYWQRGRESIPFNSIHAAHALVVARQMGYPVPQEMEAMAQAYLRDVESYYPDWYSERARQGLSAYALYVRHLVGDNDAAKARTLVDKAGGVENMPLEASGWLWPVLAADPASATYVEAISRHVNNRAVETAGAANFTTDYGDDAYLMLHSNRRTDGVILNALIDQEPDSDLIPKVVNGLLAQRTAGHWGNTQENVFILLALDNYFDTFEAQTPDFVARIWLGETYAGEHVYEGYSTERHETVIPMSLLAEEAGSQDLIVSKEGDGRLYYRLGLDYAPADLVLEPLNRGFVVQREYEAVDDPGDVFRDEEGVWHIKLGAKVRVRLTMVADNRRYHVALVDPLPAGLEPINPALAVSESGSGPAEPTPYWWWGTWYDHQNVRDERLEAFATLLWEGVYEYEYVARATTPGTFVVPPAKAEEMYAPETFGRSGSDVVVVESVTVP